MDVAIPPAQLAAPRLRSLRLLAQARVANAWLRIAATSVAAVIAHALAGGIWPSLWFAGLVAVVLCDRAIFAGLLKRCEARNGPAHLHWTGVWVLAQSAYGNLLAVILWFAPYVPGEALAVMYLCAGLANGAASLRSVPSLALCGLAPTMAMLVGLPVAEYLLRGAGNPLYLAPGVAALLMLGFGVNHWRDLLASDVAHAETEAAVLRERKSAAAAAAAKSDMIRRRNDELRTPMAALIGAAEHLRRAAASPQARAHIATLVQAGEVLKLVLNDLSDLDRLENGQVLIEPTPADPRELVRGVVSAFRSAAQDKHLELFLDVAADTPALVLIDARRVRQVLFNLLANAVRYTTHGGVRVRLQAQPVDGQAVRLLFMVADTGAGMSRSQLARVLGRERVCDGGEGPGLGLAISLKLARLMGGQITAKSGLGQGSLFSFSLVAPLVATQGRSAA